MNATSQCSQVHFKFKSKQAEKSLVFICIIAFSHFITIHRKLQICKTMQKKSVCCWNTYQASLESRRSCVLSVMLPPSHSFSLSSLLSPFFITQLWTFRCATKHIIKYSELIMSIALGFNFIASSVEIKWSFSLLVVSRCLIVVRRKILTFLRRWGFPGFFFMHSSVNNNN